MYYKFRKGKRTSSVADSQVKRNGFNNSVNVTSFNKENAYRYMSVTPSHKYHEAQKNKLFIDTPKSGTHNNFLKTSTHRIGSLSGKKERGNADPFYKSDSPIEELKDEYATKLDSNESKLSFNPSEERGEADVPSKELDVDLEAMILVEDKI